VTYGGHGIAENKVHAQPFVANRAQPNEGIRLRTGMSIAIEPLLTTGSTETWVSDDRWTVNTKNKSCHEEHTIYIHEDHTEIMTLREGETA
jgi:methionyl aminopeptidase